MIVVHCKKLISAYLRGGSRGVLGVQKQSHNRKRTITSLFIVNCMQLRKTSDVCKPVNGVNI